MRSRAAVLHGSEYSMLSGSGAAIQSAPADQITVITSDPADMRVVAGDKPVTIAAI